MTRADLKHQLDLLLQQEEIMWHQRSHNIGLREGDRNAQFFHITASNRMRKNRILEFHQDNKVLKTWTNIESAFFSFYYSLLGSQGAKHADID